MLDRLFPNGVAHYLAGGALIGAGIVLLFATTGRIGGASTVFTSTCSFFSRRPFFQQPRFTGSRGWRLVYAAGMVLGALAVVLTGVQVIPTTVGWAQLLAGGFVAGFGARLANGCTSGHGVCGLASLQLPSLVAVLTFMGTAFLTANAVLWLGDR